MTPYYLWLNILKNGKMSRIARPQEYWKVTATAENYRRERLYRGRGGKKKAMDFVTFCKNNGAMTVKLESCIPKWTIEYYWEKE